MFYDEFEVDAKADVYKRRGVPVMQGRHRRCASQQGNMLLAVIRLGLTDDRTPQAGRAAAALAVARRRLELR